MRRSLPFIFSVLVAICAVGMTIDQGHARPMPIPNLGGCDPRAYSQATRKFQTKITEGRKSILEGIIAGTSRVQNLLNACNNLIFKPARLPCITTLCNFVENEAAKKCKEDVKSKALEDTECNHRHFSPLRVKARITENIRVQCCSSLAPQGKADLLAYCDYAAKQVRDQICPVTPAVDTPVSSETLDEPSEEE